MEQVIILDIDECIVSTRENDDWYKLDPLHNSDLYPIRSRLYHTKMSDGTGKFWGIERPHLQEFIDYCLNRFKYVVIWSAGQRSYVKPLTHRIFRRMRTNPDLILNWDDCANKEFDAEGDPISWDKPIVAIKEMHPNIADSIRLDNTFFVDDRRANFEPNADNGLEIPEFDPPSTVNGLLKEDDALLKLMEWFEHDDVKYADDVRTLDKSNVWN